MTTPDIPALRAALAAAKMSLPLEADGVAVFDAEGDLVADTVSHLPGEAENAKLFVAAVNALEPLLDDLEAKLARIEKLERVAEAAGTLRGNAEGMVSLEREAIADLVSWTNVYCIEESVRQVKAALANLDGGKGS